ncbi:hypothetical protein Acel_1669 [Acidothermus cellulolyticus 11B]|jgi:Na+-driven multidrug efflux pump|uniref:Uncharacterized protein n=1 Tax=Acidothermus cellulolyticus (strain ATCC 43068 / DSM 8971 / 11B) TaxID=351607 RepID=A0LVI1_ACIC1|nr:hypothetical protein Acel_1669 [Acidothermus cellulolyticus 11B]
MTVQSRSPVGGTVRAVVPVVAAIASVLLLVLPLVTPFVAAGGMVVSYLAGRGDKRTIFKVTFVVCALVFVGALVMDSTLLGASVSPGRPSIGHAPNS